MVLIFMLTSSKTNNVLPKFLKIPFKKNLFIALKFEYGLFIVSSIFILFTSGTKTASGQKKKR